MLSREKRSAGISEEELVRLLNDASDLLLIRLRSLGDCILSLPLLDGLRAWRPDLRLDVLVEAPFAPVFLGHPAVSETLILRTSAQSRSEGLTRFGAAREVFRRRYRVVLNLHGGTTSVLFSLAASRATRIGQENFRHAWAYHALVPESVRVWNRSRLHTVEHQLTLLRWLGREIPEPIPVSLRVPLEARLRVRDRLARSGIAAGHFIQVHPTATLATKQWPEWCFARAADQLSVRSGLPVVFTSAPRENRVLAKVREEADRVHRYWADLSLEELFALTESCRLFLGNDSGPTHAAAALGVPLVVVWGSSNFDVWRPWNTVHEAVRSDLPCIPCPGYSCAEFGRPKCILDISPVRVIEACERMLRRCGPRNPTD